MNTNNNIIRTPITLAAAVALALLIAAPGRAQTLTLTTTDQAANPGDAVTFMGTLENNGVDTLTLTSGNLTVDSGPGAPDADSDPIQDLFLAGTPLTLAPGVSRTFSLFTLDAQTPTGATGDTIMGTYSVNLADQATGGAGISDLVSYRVAVAPEPSAFVGLGLGVLSLAGLALRRRFAAGRTVGY